MVKVECGTADTSPAMRAAVPFGSYVLDVWLPRSGYAAGTRRHMRLLIRNDLAPLADRSVAWVASHRDEVAAVIAASGRSDHGMAYTLVKRSLDEAVNSGLIEGHRLAGLKVKRNLNRREIVPTTPEQREAIAAGLGRNGLVVWLMHGCGLRLSEALGIHGSDFRDSFTTVRVQRQAYLGEPAPLKARRPGQFRDVPVPATVAAMVRVRVAQDGLGPLFPGRALRQGGKPYLNSETVGRHVRDLAGSRVLARLR